MNVKSNNKIEFNHPPKVCVLLATCNGDRYLKKQIDTILSQKNVSVTIIASDDHSTDQTTKILQHYNILTFENIYKSSSCANFLNLMFRVNNLELSDEYDFFALSDQDDIWYEYKLINAIKNMKTNDSEIYSSNFYFRRKGLLTTSLTKSSKVFDINRYSAIFRSPGPGFTYVFNKKSFKMIVQHAIFKTFVPDQEIKFRWHDWLIFTISRSLKLSWSLSDNADAEYRLHDSNDTGVIGLNNFYRRLKFFFDGDYILECTKMCDMLGEIKIKDLLNTKNFLHRFELLKYEKLARSIWYERIIISLSFLFSIRKHYEK